MTPSPTQRPTQLASVTAPKQARSEQTLYRLLDAAQELIAAKGLADVSIPEIVRRAGSSVGGFYGRRNARFLEHLRKRGIPLYEDE